MTSPPDEPTTPASVPTEDPDAGRAAAAQVRGSSMLLTGRLLSLGLNLVSQVLVVRYLAKADYGLFAYGLSIAAFVQIVVSLGQERSITRFLAVFDERGQYDRLLGTVWLYAGTVLCGTAVAVTVVAALGGTLGGSLDVPDAELVLVVLILTAPLDAFDKLLEGFFAVFSRPRAIFFRKYLLQPVVKILVIGLLVLTQSSVVFLAVGQVAAGLLGLTLYALQLPTILRTRGLTEKLDRRRVSVPYREVLGFSVPLLTGELVYLSMNTVSVVLLGIFRDAEAVGGYRAIFPAARLNQLVLFSFSLLFLPLVSRLYARRDGPGMRHAYWQTAGWLAVLSFPVFAVTVPLAEPFTVLLFGDRYAPSAPYLAILSAGFYLNAALGFNQQTLQVYGQIRWVVGVNVGMAAANVVLSLALIPWLGALGVAVANSSTLVAQNVANQIGLGRLTPAGYFSREHTRVYGSLVVAALGLGALQLVLSPPPVVGLAAAASASLTLLRINRGALRVAETFPEIRSVPLLRRIVE